MAFIKQVSVDNRVNLIVSMATDENSEYFFNSDSIAAAIQYFKLYEKNGQLYQKTAEEDALEEIGIGASDAATLHTALDSVINTIDDETAVAVSVLFPVWAAGVSYTVGQRVRYNNFLYKVLQAHTSQADWTPTAAPSLFARILTDEETGEILPWEQPDSTNGYATGAIVSHNGTYYISTADNNVWEPGTTGAPWKIYHAPYESGKTYSINDVVEYNGLLYESIIDSNTVVPGTDGSAWIEYADLFVQGSIYMIGDRVSFEGKIYSSTIDNNSYSPTAYPAGWAQIN